MTHLFSRFFPVCMLLTVILAWPINGYSCGEGGEGGGNGDMFADVSTASVAPSGFNADFGGQSQADTGYQVVEIIDDPIAPSAPYGMPGTYHMVEQQDYGQGYSSQWADAQASADTLKDIAIFSGGMLVGYATAGSSLAIKMIAAGGYAASTSGSDSTPSQRGTNALQDTVIAATPLPTPVQSFLSLGITTARDVMPETESSADPSTGFGFTYSN